MKNIVILGSTGSIGTQTLDIVQRLPDQLRVVGLSAHRNRKLLLEQAIEFHVPETSLSLGDEAGLVRLATETNADIVVVSVAGAVGIQATIAALESGKDVALATKEVLVAAGEIVMRTAKQNGRCILPIDSEHSAIFQCLHGRNSQDVDKIWLTASGGPFRDWPIERIQRATLQDALYHPTWPTMGRKITVDSATMMNKGLETIEARWLFDIPIEHIEVTVHPQSIVHSLVGFRDSSVLAQLGLPDMRVPIEYALLGPERIDAGLPRLDIATLSTPLTFSAPDETRFPCLRLARRAAQESGTAPAVLNAANEAAVGLFLEEELNFPAIATLVEHVLDAHQNELSPTLDQIFAVDAWARQKTREFAGTDLSLRRKEALS